MFLKKMIAAYKTVFKKYCVQAVVLGIVYCFSFPTMLGIKKILYLNEKQT